MDSKPGCKLQEEKEKKEVGEKEMKESCTYVIAIKEEGLRRGYPKVRRQVAGPGAAGEPPYKGCAASCPPRGWMCVWLPSQPGCLAIDQLTLEKASSLEQD